jgi:hypothetical protein
MSAPAPVKEKVKEEVAPAPAPAPVAAPAEPMAWRIIAPIANPKHPVWTGFNDKSQNPWKPEYPKDNGNFELHVESIVYGSEKLPDGSTIALKTEGQDIEMRDGVGYTFDERIARFVESYYRYEIQQVPVREIYINPYKKFMQPQQPQF